MPYLCLNYNIPIWLMTIKTTKETMTKKHFKKIAEIMFSNKAGNFTNHKDQRKDLINKLSTYFKSINENFDEEKFVYACTFNK